MLGGCRLLLFGGHGLVAVWCLFCKWLLFASAVDVGCCCCGLVLLFVVNVVCWLLVLFAAGGVVVGRLLFVVGC